MLDIVDSQAIEGLEACGFEDLRSGEVKARLLWKQMIGEEPLKSHYASGDSIVMAALRRKRKVVNDELSMAMKRLSKWRLDTKWRLNPKWRGY